jgi:hypothetical protein
MSLTFEESKMTFGPYSDGQYFHLEQSDIYKKIKQDGVKTVEVLLMPENSREILFIEAKQTEPNPEAKYHRLNPAIDEIESLLNRLSQDSKHLATLNRVKKELGRFKNESWYDDVKEKFSCSLSLFFSIYLNRHNNDLPDTFKQISANELKIRLIIVIKSCDEDHLDHVNSCLAKTLKPIIKTWNLGASAVVAINEEMARKRNIVV